MQDQLNYLTFPEKLKIAKVIPVFKKGEKENVENYRPIFIRPFFSKVLERIMYNLLYEYFMNNNFLHENQFGFQINNLTDHAILQLTRDIKILLKRCLKNFEEKMTFIELQTSLIMLPLIS